MKKILSFLLVLTLISCKNEKPQDQETPKAEAQVTGNDFYTVTLDLVAQKDDAFHVFYTEDGSVNFDENNSVWAEFKGSPNSQKLVFNLKKGVIPNQMRFDFGLNKEQGDVKLNSIEITCLDQKLTYSGAQIFKYFRPNESSTTVDMATQTLKPIKAGDNVSLYPLEALKPELESIMK
jgi:hypothetical protein